MKYVSPKFGRTTPRFQKGLVGYARLLVSIMRGARSKHDLEHTHGIHQARAIDFMLRLRARRLVHVARWTLNPSRRGTPTPYFAWGGQADAPLPLRFDGTTRRPPRDFDRVVAVSAEQLAFMLAIEALQKGGATKEELCEFSGLFPDAIRRLLVALREGDATYVCDWRWPHGYPVEVHGLCTPLEPRVDVPRPKPCAQKRGRKSPQKGGLAIDTKVVMVA